MMHFCHRFYFQYDTAIPVNILSRNNVVSTVAYHRCHCRHEGVCQLGRELAVQPPPPRMPPLARVVAPPAIRFQLADVGQPLRHHRWLLHPRYNVGATTYATRPLPLCRQPTSWQPLLRHRWRAIRVKNVDVTICVPPLAMPPARVCLWVPHHRRHCATTLPPSRHPSNVNWDTDTCVGTFTCSVEKFVLIFLL